MKTGKKQRSSATFIAAIIIVFSAMTFWLPRETFDPHIGVDYDIFCQVFSNLASYDAFEIYESKIIIIITIINETKSDPVHRSLIYNLPLIIRPPPGISFLKYSA